MENFSNPQEQKRLPEITLEKELSFKSTLSPIYSAVIKSNEDENIGHVDFQIFNQKGKIIIQSIDIKQPGKDYGKAVYKAIQDSYPDYILVSSDSMTHKTDPNQELPDAKNLWESLVRNGFAEKTETGYQMKK